MTQPAPKNMQEVKDRLASLKEFLTACPHADLKTDENAEAQELGKHAWSFAKSDRSLLKDAQEIQQEITAMTTPAKGAARRAGPPGLGDAVTVTPPDAVRKYLSGLEWDGESRLTNPVYVQTVLGMDKPDEIGLLRQFCISAIARLFKPGTPVKPLVLGGKRGSVDPLSTALMPTGAGEVYCVAARNLKPERATFLTVFDGVGKADKQDIPLRTQDTFRRPRTDAEVTEQRWFSPIIRAGSPAGEFIAVSGDPNLALLKQDNTQIWAEAYSLYYSEIGSKQTAQQAQVQDQGKPAQDKAKAKDSKAK